MAKEYYGPPAPHTTWEARRPPRPSVMEDEQSQILGALNEIMGKEWQEAEQEAEFSSLFAEKQMDPRSASAVGPARTAPRGLGGSLLAQASAPMKRTYDLGFGVPEGMEQYQIDPSLMQEFVDQSRSEVDKFLKSKTRKPKGLFSSGDPERTADDLARRIYSGQLQAFTLPEEEYDERFGIEEGPRHLGEGGRNVDGKIYMKGMDPESVKGVGHEVLHEFFGHEPGKGGVPKLNPYQKLDMALGGILPSFSKHGYRPSFFPKGKGMEDFKSRKEYNERVRELGYHPQYADAPFKVTQDSMLEALTGRTRAGVLSTPMSTVETRGGDYDVFEKRSIKARDFRSAFKEARKNNLPTFEWQGRLYSTEMK